MAVKPETRAEKLLAQRVELESEIEAAKKKAGIPKLETKLEKVKADLVSVMTEHEIEQVEGDGVHATLVRQNYGAMFLATIEDVRALDEIPDDREIEPMRAIIKAKFGAFAKGSKSSEIWKRITKPVIVPEAIEEVVAEGLLSVDEIAPAFIEKAKKPYARIFRDS